MYFPLFVGVLCLSLFRYVLLCVHCSLVIILKRKRKLVALPFLSCRCIVTINVLWLILTMPCVGLQRVIVVFPDQTYFFYMIYGDIGIIDAHCLVLAVLSKTFLKPCFKMGFLMGSICSNT